MVIVSKRTLKILAALFWYIGGLVLLLKASSLLQEAYSLKSELTPVLFALSLGFIVGVLKAKFLFTKACKKNLIRIQSIEKPLFWQFFRPRFFLFLVLMMITGATLSRSAHENYPFLLAVAILDITIGIALLGSSYLFWISKERLKII